MSLLQQNEDVRTQIAAHIEKKGIMKKWLAENIGVSQGHLGLVLKGDRVLTDDLLAKINVQLETQFTKSTGEPAKQMG